MKRETSIPEIWIEVSNIALQEGEPVGKAKVMAKVEAEAEAEVFIEVQLKGDNEDDRWLVFKSSVEKFEPLMEAMKDKRPIHARLSPDGSSLKVTALRISFSASPVRG